MINPSVFFPDRPSGPIKHIPKIPSESRHPCVACNCLIPKIGASAKPDPVDCVISLEAKTLIHKEQAVVFWTGTCPACKTWFWHSTTWDWVGWMNDLETCKMLLNAIPFQHILSEHAKGVAGITIHAGTRLYFENGKLKRISN